MEFLKNQFWAMIGIAGSAGAAMSRLRLDFLTCSGYVLMVLGMVALAGVGGSLMNEKEPKEPVSVPLGKLDDSYYGPYHVKFSGTADANLALELKPKYATESSESDESRKFVAVVDKAGGGAIMVELHSTVKDGETRAFEGMLEFSQPELYLNLPEKVGGVPVNHKLYLQEGATPGDPVSFMGVGLVASVLFVPFALASLQQYIVFRTRERRYNPVRVPRFAANPPDTLFMASGGFEIDRKTRKRFLSVPAILATDETGGLAVLANPDATDKNSFYFVPATIQQQAGMWRVDFRLEWIGSVDIGEQYVGSKPVPAIRLYIASRGNVTLATADRDARDALANYLLPKVPEIGV